MPTSSSALGPGCPVKFKSTWPFPPPPPPPARKCAFGKHQFNPTPTELHGINAPKIQRRPTITGVHESRKLQPRSSIADAHRIAQCLSFARSPPSPGRGG